MAGDGSYAPVTSNEVTITVAKKTLTVTADNKSKAYGEANPALTIQYSGFVGSDNAASLTTQPAASTTATAGSSAGTYSITVSGGVSDNYSFTYVNGTLTVTAITLTVNIVSASGTTTGSVAVTGGIKPSYMYGESVTVTATPNTAVSPYAFLKWVATDNPSAAAMAGAGVSYTFTITENTTLYAVFSVPSVSLGIIVNPFGIITSGAGATGNVVIPRVVDGIAVIAFSQSAFENNTNITGIVVPESITTNYVFDVVFRGCTALQSVTLPNNPEYFEIGQSMFEGCTSLASITIPSGVNLIWGFAFRNCTNLKTIIFTGVVPTINTGVFAGVTLTNVYYTPAALAADPNWATAVIGGVAAQLMP
jgi:hypothetical protein